MPLLSTLSANPLQKVFVYGGSGTGKTVFATSFPGEIRHWDFDGKVASAVSHWARVEKDRLDRIDTENYQRWAETPEQFAQWYTDFVKLEKLARSGEKFPFDTVILDSMTLWCDALMREIIRQNPGIKGPITTAPNVPGLQHYMIFGVKFRELLNRIIALPCHVVIVGHIETEKDEYTGRIMQKPLLPGRNASYLPIIFGEVYKSSCELGPDKTYNFWADTKASDNYVARSQIPGLPARIPLTFESLVKNY